MGRLRKFLAKIWRPALLGGFVFWLPDLLYHYVARSEPKSSAILVLTVTMSAGVIIAYFLSKPYVRHAVSRSLSVLIGIWVLGPTIILLGQTYQGAGFRNPQSIPYWAVATIFPPLTLVMAGFDLSIFALLLATTSLLILYWVVERERIQSPVQK